MEAWMIVIFTIGACVVAGVVMLLPGTRKGPMVLHLKIAKSPPRTEGQDQGQ